MNNFVGTIPVSEIAQFCQRWKIQELALFGSVLHDDFNPDSDVDVLVDFTADADRGLLDHVKMQQGLQALLQRNIDLITKRAVEHSPNWLLRNEILRTAQPLFPCSGMKRLCSTSPKRLTRSRLSSKVGTKRPF